MPPSEISAQSLQNIKNGKSVYIKYRDDGHIGTVSCSLLRRPTGSMSEMTRSAMSENEKTSLHKQSQKSGSTLIKDFFHQFQKIETSNDGPQRMMLRPQARDSSQSSGALIEMRKMQDEVRQTKEKMRQMATELQDASEMPDQYKCRLTMDRMKDTRFPLLVQMTDPVIQMDGRSYERSAIEDWYRNNDTSPLTNEKISSKRLVDNYCLKSQIEDWAKLTTGISTFMDVQSRYTCPPARKIRKQRIHTDEKDDAPQTAPHTDQNYDAPHTDQNYDAPHTDQKYDGSSPKRNPRYQQAPDVRICPDCTSQNPQTERVCSECCHIFDDNQTAMDTPNPHTDQNYDGPHTDQKNDGPQHRARQMRKMQDELRQMKEQMRQMETELQDVRQNASEIPDQYACPITFELMKDPVIQMDGRSYERSAIVDWFSRNHTSPLGGQKISSELIPNVSLKQQIHAWKQKWTREFQMS